MKGTSSSSIRGPGQRSIRSTFLIKCSSVTKESSDAPSTKGFCGFRSRPSLSAFLDRKLPIHKAEKENPSSSLENKHSSDEKRPTIEDSVFKLFSDKQGGKVGEASSQGLTDATEISRSEGDKKHSKNLVVVLGDDPKPRTHAGISRSRKRARPFYNHYESGSGWWDSEREGIDEDEVGCKDVWEGVGSTTLGGLDWN